MMAAGFSIFHFYRRILAIVVCTHVVLHLATYVWQWRAARQSADRGEAMLRRYLETVILRSRLRRFWLDLMEIAVLAGVFAYVVGLHR